MKIIRPEHATRFPDLTDLSEEEIKEAYDLSKASLTAEDLQRYTQEEEGVTGEEILRRFEEQQRRIDESQ